MKVFISADIEGVTGCTHWDDANKNHAAYSPFAKQMTAEVVAACHGALKAGATEIVVKDAHATGRNIIPDALPHEARLIRGWTSDPYSMMAGLDENFDAAMMIGYHAGANSDSSPLAHTLTGKVASVKINDSYASEFRINSYTAGLFGVPVVFLAGDEGICNEGTSYLPQLTTVAVQKGLGNATESIHPALAVKQIQQGARVALANVEHCAVTMPEHFAVEVRHKLHTTARTVSFYPGARLIEPHVVGFESDDYFEVLCFFMFGISQASG